MKFITTSHLRPATLRLVASTLIGVALATMAANRLDAQQANDENSGGKKADSAKQLWFGEMNVQDVRRFRFLLELAPQGDAWSGVLTSLDEGSRQFPLADVARSDTAFGFKLTTTGAAYEGAVKEGGLSISGKWRQSGGEFDLEFRKVQQPPVRKIKTAWKGTINALIQKLDVAFVELESGEWFFDSLTQKAGGFVAKDESKDEDVILRVPGVRGVFQGKYSDDKSRIEGRWRQGLIPFELVLTKAAASDLAPRQAIRPQTPQPPFPYDSEELSFPSQDKSVTLSGTLTTPRGEIKGGVVLVSGSGAQDRDETLLDHKPFWVIADHFARYGIATLRYDDRGTGRSTGDFAKATTFDFANDAEGALERLRTLAPLSGAPLGLCGHSEGGLIAPIVAARNEHVAFIVLLAGPGVNGEKILYNQSKLILEAEGASAADQESQAVFQRALLSSVVKHPEDTPETLEAKILAALKSELSAKELEDGDYPAKIKAGLKAVSSPWFRTFLTLEPQDALAKVSCPVLAVNGEKDLQVDPKLNLPAIRAALEKAGNTQFEIVEFPGLNHLFQSCKTGAVSEYQGIEETFNETPLRKITEWILALRSKTR